MYNLSNICKATNELVKNGYTKSEVFKKAWQLAKNVISKVSGVTFGRRNKALERLTHYKPKQINIQLLKEENNPFNSNAISVMATVKGKGSVIFNLFFTEYIVYHAPILAEIWLLQVIP